MISRFVLVAAAGAVCLSAQSFAQEANFWYRHKVVGISASNAPTPPSNAAPVIAEVDPTGSAGSGSTFYPFYFAQVTDADEDDVLTAIITIDDPASVVPTLFDGFVSEGEGVYSTTGTPVLVSSRLRSFAVTSDASRLSPGTSEDVLFHLQVTDGAGASDTATASVTISQPPNDAPVIAGLPSGLTTIPGSPISPFTTITVTDPEDDEITLSILVDDVGKGSFTTPVGFSDVGGGTLQRAGAPSVLTSALQWMVYTPATGRLDPGESEIVSFDLRAQDVFGFESSSTVTVSVHAPPNVAPSFVNLPTGLTMEVGETITPFVSSSISDPNNTTVIVEVSLDDDAKGTLSSLGGFTKIGAVYTYSAVPSAATTAFRGLSFTPAEGRLSPGQSETVTFSLTVDDSYESVSRTVTVAVTAPAAPAGGCNGSSEIGAICEDGAIYVGMSNGSPLFADSHDSPEIGWGGFEGLSSPAPLSTTDGAANTDLIVAHQSISAAARCRSKGPEWYLPAIEELRLVRDAYLAGVLPNVTPDDYLGWWASTLSGTPDPSLGEWDLQFLIWGIMPIYEFEHSGFVTWDPSMRARCVRR